MSIVKDQVTSTAHIPRTKINLALGQSCQPRKKWNCDKAKLIERHQHCKLWGCSYVERKSRAEWYSSRIVLIIAVAWQTKRTQKKEAAREG